MCNPEPPSNSPRSALMISESRLRTLPGRQMDVSNEFTRFRELLWGYIEVFKDLNTHVLVWNTIDVFGKVAPADYQATGSQETLDRVKNAVESALSLL